MDTAKLDEIIAYYKANYKKIRLRENYKWEAAAEYRRAAMMRAEDFPEAFREAFSATGNLLDSGYYYPRTNLFLFLKKDPMRVRSMFVSLFDSDTDPEERIRAFIREADAMKKQYFTDEEMPDHHQDEHAVSVYLFFEYPEDFYIYKYTPFRTMAEQIRYSFVPRRKNERNFPAYGEFCDALCRRLMKDEELMALERERHELYPGADPAYHLLTQDVINCAASYYRRGGLSAEGRAPMRAAKFREIPVRQPQELAAIPFFDPEDILRYERSIQDAAKAFILQEELLRIRSYRIAAKKLPRILSEGEALGEGYDILSYDRRGREVYITVRATKGAAGEGFSLTEAERVKSSRVPEQYRLYRVSRFDQETGTGEISVYQGDLTPLCLNPERYRVVFGGRED